MARYIDADKIVYWTRYVSPNGLEHDVRKVAFRDEIERMPTADVAPRAAWISVENPPDDYRDEYGELIPFLVCCHGTRYPFRAMYDGKNWGDGIGILKVTHWIPLPKPPKGEKHDPA